MRQGLGPLLAACLGVAAATAQGSVRRVVTPDGSTFILVARQGRPVVYWASFVRMGRVHEGPGQAGLGVACVRSSLLGTASHGSTSAHEEAAALLELDRAESQLDAALRAGREPEEIDRLKARRDAALRESRQFGDPLAFGRLWARLPALPPRVTPMVDGTLLETAVPTARLPQLMRLSESRRREALLRRLDEAIATARAERDRQVTGKEHLRALALLALEVHPARLALRKPGDQRRVRRKEAIEFYRTYQRPERTFTALVGSFDADEVAAELQRVFVQVPHDAAPVPLPVEPPQNGRKSRRIRSDERRIVLGWRSPTGARADLREICARLLAGDDTFGLTARLVHEERLATGIEAIAGFPSRTSLGLLVLSASARDKAGFDQLRHALGKHVDDLRRAVAAAPVARAIAVWWTERQQLLDTPSKVARWLALRAGLGLSAELDAAAPTEAAVRAKLAEMLDAGSENEVISEVEGRG